MITAGDVVKILHRVALANARLARKAERVVAQVVDQIARNQITFLLS